MIVVLQHESSIAGVETLSTTSNSNEVVVHLDHRRWSLPSLVISIDLYLNPLGSVVCCPLFRWYTFSPTFSVEDFFQYDLLAILLMSLCFNISFWCDGFVPRGTLDLIFLIRFDLILYQTVLLERVIWLSQFGCVSGYFMDISCCSHFATMCYW